MYKNYVDVLKDVIQDLREYQHILFDSNNPCDNSYVSIVQIRIDELESLIIQLR